MMREENHIFQGMRRDNHPIRLDGKFLWDAHNIRITNREDNTLLSITNERGNALVHGNILGDYVGHCIVGKYLVLFTYDYYYKRWFIYRMDLPFNSTSKTIILFESSNKLWKNSWNTSNPIEALGYYESEFVLKVYWVDGKNQPRVINVAEPELKIPELYLVNGVNLSNFTKIGNLTIRKWYQDNYPEGFYLEDSFDFVRTLKLLEQVEITKITGTNGSFPSGVILYAFSYYKKYGSESNIFYISPLQYTSPFNRGGSPEEKVGDSFSIEINYVDPSFDYLRIYSILRTSIDAEPTVKIVRDIAIEKLVSNNKTKAKPILFTDDGTTGSVVDPTYLLYVGGKSIIASTLTLKDRTLFLGNITLKLSTLDFESLLKEDFEFDDNNLELDYLSNISLDKYTYYDYKPNLNSGNTARFKAGETYRCGVQVLTEDGVWSEPIYMGDTVLNAIEPFLDGIIHSSSLNIFTPYLDLYNAGIRKIRACIAVPKLLRRKIICLGILCPTVYSVNGRKTGTPYAMSSWFFRPQTKISEPLTNVYLGAYILWQHNKSLFTANTELSLNYLARGAEILNMIHGNIDLNLVLESSSDFNSYLNDFFVDENIVTFHSPDLEFDTNLANMDWTGTKLQIIGIALLEAVSGDIDILASAPAEYTAGAFMHLMIGYQTNTPSTVNGGLVSGLFYNDAIMRRDDEGGYWPGGGTWYLTYPWHRSGSLNNDVNREGRSAVLDKKVISNLKFFDKNSPIDLTLIYNISTPQFFNSNELTILKVSPEYFSTEVSYLGNVDTLLSSNTSYPIKSGANFEADINTVGTGILTSNDPVRMKYKSTPHLVFSLGPKRGVNDKSIITLLPKHRYLGEGLLGDFNFPSWQTVGTNANNNDSSVVLGELFFYSSEESFPHIASRSEIGLFGYSYTPTGLSVWEVVNTPSGPKKHVEPYVGKVFKALYNRCKVRYDYINDSLLLPGTNRKQYKPVNSFTVVYTGPIKYYKVVEIKGNPGLYRLLDVTDEIQLKLDSLTDRHYTLSQDTFGEENKAVPPYLLLAEIIRESTDDSDIVTLEELQQEQWIPAGRPITLEPYTDLLTVPYEYGDTWYSRYDCLKTYPFTLEDVNKVVEIGSFMCETRVNIDGRYDRNRGQTSNLTMTPLNFNLLNEVYSLKDNFFSYRILDKDLYKQNWFPNQITWSKEKTAGEEIDTWTNITMANTLDMDGSLGSVTALTAWNEYLLCFLDRSLNQILFNSRVLVPVSDGVPVEISNGYKVDGSRIINSNIGCTNKWSIAPSNKGIYFIDSNTYNIYLFNGLLSNLSLDNGMSQWVKDSTPRTPWSPKETMTINNIRTYYDKNNEDVYFSPGPVSRYLKDKSLALCYSERLGCFTSFMSYGGDLPMFNYDGKFYALHYANLKVDIYENNAGNYNMFYGVILPWEFSFISNDLPLNTKVFDTIELRGDLYDLNLSIPSNECPINEIEVNNEYLQASAIFNNKTMRKKFRVWRGLIPRNNGTRERIRNPWSMITLKGPANLKAAIILDVTVKYTV